MRKIIRSLVVLFILVCFYSCKDNVTGAVFQPTYDTSITYTNEYGQVLGGDSTDWCFYCSTELGCYGIRPAFPNPVPATSHLKINFEIGSTIPIKLYYLNNPDTVFLVNDIYQAGTYLLEASSLNLHNTYRKFYIQSGDFICSGDVKFN